MPELSVSTLEVARLTARVAQLEAELASKPVIDRANLYRLTDTTPWGVFAISLDGRLEYANPAVQRWMTCQPPGMGRPLAEALSEPLREILLPRVDAACEGEPSQIDCQLADAAGQLRNLQIAVTPRFVGLGCFSGCIVQLSDVTEANTFYATRVENERRMRLAMDAGHMAVWEFDVATGRLLAGDELARLLGYPAGATPTAEEIRTGYTPEDWDRMSQIARENQARGEYGVEAELRHQGPDGVQRTLLLRLEMLRDAAGQVVKGHGVLVDITQRKKAETAQRLLVNELNHRVKNTLAVVQSMARQTLRGRADQSVAWRDFGDRLVALAKAHDLLTAESWASADLREVIAHATMPSAGRVVTAGPELRLTPKLALSLSMAFHELMTNAAKYGALTTAAGAIALNWSVQEDRLHLTWREAGGPIVEPPRERGFGSRLLEGALATEVGGRVILDFAPTGLVCHIEARLPPLEVQLPAAGLLGSDLR